MNGLLNSYYTGGPYATDGHDGSTLGGSFGLNVGSEVFKVQVGITGLLLAAAFVLLILHRSGNRYSVHVG